MRSRMLSFLLLLVALLLGATSVALASPPATAAGAAVACSHDFIDVSSNNEPPPIDEAAYARAGHDCEVIKANEGGPGNYSWWRHGELVDQAHAAGVRVGHLDFTRPSFCPDAAMTACGASEAATLIAAARAHWRPGDWLVADIEAQCNPKGTHCVSDAAMAAYTRGWLAAATATGWPVWVYSGWWFVGPRPQLLTAIGTTDFWISGYQTVQPDSHGLRVVAWQYTDRALVAGVGRLVDASHPITGKPTAKPVVARPGTTPTVPGHTTVLSPNPWQPNRLVAISGRSLTWWLLVLWDGQRLGREHVPDRAALDAARAKHLSTQVLMPTVANRQRLGSVPVRTWRAP